MSRRQPQKYLATLRHTDATQEASLPRTFVLKMISFPGMGLIFASRFGFYFVVA